MIPTVDLLMPVLNEEDCLAESVAKLHGFMDDQPYDWRICIIDNGSTDRTPQICYELALKYNSKLCYMRLEERGVGLAIRHGMKRSSADVMVYLDADMSSDLNYLPVLINAVVFHEYDVVFGSRLMGQSIVTGRRPWRVVTSRVNSFIIRTVFFPFPFRDVQCGFKSFSRRVVHEMLDEVEDDAWFFNPEFVIRAQGNDYKMLEVPIVWRDDPSSKLNIWTVSPRLFHGYLRLKWERIQRWFGLFRQRREEKA